MIESPLELHQFSHSHFCEKARWALDLKGVRHLRINYLPGPHVPRIRSISGQTQVPVLKVDGRFVHGSAAIVDLVEKRWPTPALYPAEPAARDEALAIQARLDEDLDPDIRRAGFECMLEDAAYVTATFAPDKPAWTRRLYQATFPLTRIVMKKAMNITPEAARRSRAKVEAALDFLAEKSAATGYLVGDAFSVADLTAVSLLGPALDIERPDAKAAAPRPPRYAALCEEWNRHPAMAWAAGIWKRHRPESQGTVIC